MKRRQVLSGLAAGFALGPGCLKTFDSDGGGTPSTDSGGETPTANGTNRSTNSQTATQNNSSSTGSPSQGALIDTGNLATYTNNTYSYSINYPADWRLTTNDPKTVRIRDPDSPARMLVRVKDGVASFIPRETIIGIAIQQAKRRYSIDKVTRLGQRETTLPNGTPATLVKTRLQRSGTGMVLRGTFIIAHVADTVYAAGVFVPERAVTPSLTRAMTEIVTSLTIQ
ncbi:PsbP-related protein [Halocatena pleomorpha]|uniref:Uncharacterized protein n=1 Tax=Halocatena pleomorpha TaxID=1785090 RepID=A0A3P3RDH4_9EURY|nr:PsbP-related protein [Halocatena pleomorpha]RRJ31506.1 hypothetical protein EIK79_07275 [Halocatena pleomorpha]